MTKKLEMEEIYKGVKIRIYSYPDCDDPSVRLNFIDAIDEESGFRAHCPSGIYSTPASAMSDAKFYTNIAYKYYNSGETK